MRRATFLLSKDPTVDHGGDIELSRLMMSLAAESTRVDAICLSREAGPSPDAAVQRIPKPPVTPLTLAARSVARRRSLVHTRFTIPAMTAALDQRQPDLVVAEHNYMAECFLESRQREHGTLFVNTVNSESLVWRATRGVLGRVEAPRIVADERRTARAAYAVGTYDRDEAASYRQHGSPRARWLDISLPPAERVAVAQSPARLLFVGDRSWPPNQEAFETLIDWWPAIARGIPHAELHVIGRPGSSRRVPSLPAGMRDLGFVENLDRALGQARALLAPITTGGGVRVKLLDAARRGLPVVPTSAAIGSLGEVFGIDAVDGHEAFVARAREFVLDRAAASVEADRLYAVNAARWTERVPHRSVQDWLDS